MVSESGGNPTPRKGITDSLASAMGKRIVAVWISLAVAIFATVYLVTYQEKLRLDLDRVNICLYPLVLVKFVTALALISFILTAYYLSTERDMDFVYGVLYAFYAFMFVKWIKPYAFLTLRDGRWLTR